MPLLNLICQRQTIQHKSRFYHRRRWWWLVLLLLLRQRRQERIPSLRQTVHAVQISPRIARSWQDRQVSRKTHRTKPNRNRMAKVNQPGARMPHIEEQIKWERSFLYNTWCKISICFHYFWWTSLPAQGRQILPFFKRNNELWRWLFPNQTRDNWYLRNQTSNAKNILAFGIFRQPGPSCHQETDWVTARLFLR